ncbi:hypothetical protein [Rufibacter sp. LB8]|uniref:hypothetical protein n=1 Tax=Rufibacter sp. LB8 TaxID=2777781 RepID=UPI00178C6E05|nr:hypothetical protein [Rufibacter sp. LB8]
MELQDVILLDLFSKVRHHADPADHPASSSQIAQDTNLPLPLVLSLGQELLHEGFVAISPLHHPPLLYITIVGIARAKRLILTTPENRQTS